MRSRMTSALLASMAVGTLALGVPSAGASPSGTDDTSASACTKHWTLRVNNHTKGEACYSDNGNRARVRDLKRDGRSVVLVISKRGANTKCWDRDGSGPSGTTCAINRWAENTRVHGRLCPGEWARSPAHRVIHWNRCTPFKRFRI